MNSKQSLTNETLHSKKRLSDLKKIRKKCKKEVLFSNDSSITFHADSLELLKKFPSKSVSLILTDPPYHVTKKKNIKGDTAFRTDKDYLDWMKQIIIEWRRIIRPNGSIFCFCHGLMSSNLEVLLSDSFNVLSHIVWTKPNEPGFDGWKGKMNKKSLRKWYPHSERILFAEPAVEGNLRRSPFGILLREMRTKAGLSMHELAGMIGAHGKVNHGGSVSNWEAGRNIPSREQLKKIQDVFLRTGKFDSVDSYEDLIRPFNMDKTKQFTDVWNFPSVRQYKGKHPAEKPISLLEHAINATTYPNDIVLDCFSGSGSCAIAALKNNRLSISIEIENKWASIIANRVQTFCDNRPHYSDTAIDTLGTIPILNDSQESLFFETT